MVYVTIIQRDNEIPSDYYSYYLPISSVSLSIGRSHIHRAFGLHGCLRFPPGPSLVVPDLPRGLHLDLAPVPIHINVRATA